MHHGHHFFHVGHLVLWALLALALYLARRRIARAWKYWTS
jgi:hypothetical protein